MMAVCFSGIIYNFFFIYFFQQNIFINYILNIFICSGSTTGRVQVFRFPLTLPGEWQEYKIHGDTITQMKLALDDNRLITASKDGSLCIWKVKTIEGMFFKELNLICVSIFFYFSSFKIFDFT